MSHDCATWLRRYSMAEEEQILKRPVYSCLYCRSQFTKSDDGNTLSRIRHPDGKLVPNALVPPVAPMGVTA